MSRGVSVPEKVGLPRESCAEEEALTYRILSWAGDHGRQYMTCTVDASVSFAKWSARGVMLYRGVERVLVERYVLPGEQRLDLKARVSMVVAVVLVRNRALLFPSFLPHEGASPAG